MKIASMTAAAVLALVSTSANADGIQAGAGAGSLQARGLLQSNMTYTTVAGATAARTSIYNGVGSIFVNTVATGPNSGYLCTASLINSTTVISAAHCIYDHNEATGARDQITNIRLYLPSFGDRGQVTTEVFTASQFAFNPLYNDPNAPGFGDIGSGYDLSLITLDRAAVGHDTYGLYMGTNPLGQFIEVGTGSSGGPTGYSGNDALKRVGTNLYEYYGDDVFNDVSHGVVLSDFDDGTATHDVFGRAGGNIQRGVTGESNSAPGDSGGPEFNSLGQIVSVTSFGVTGAVFQGYCGTAPSGSAASIDPYRWTNSAHTAVTTAYTTNLSLCTNSSVGEMAGNTLVSYNAAFINAYLSGRAAVTQPVPEPATWALMLAGFGLAGYAMRRRRATVAVA